MANDLTALIKYSLLPNSLAALRENSIMAKLIWNNFENTVVEQNQKIRVARPTIAGDAVDINFTTANTPKNVTPDYVDITMDQWKEQVFQLSDKEIQETMVSGHLPRTMESMIVGMANTIDKAILNLGKQVYQFSGTAGTTPQTVAAYTALRKKMNDSLIPDNPGARKLVIDTAAEDKFNQLFYQAYVTGNARTLEDGELVRKYNMDIMMDQNVQTMTNGTSTGATIGTCAAGAKSCNLTAGGASATIKAGTLFTVAGVSQQFVVTANNTLDGTGATTTNMTFEPAAPVALTGLALTFIASHTMNLAFAYDAFAIAWRPLAQTELVPNSNSIRETMVDPISNIPMMIETWREPGTMQNKFAIRMAYGVACTSPERAVRFLG